MDFFKLGLRNILGITLPGAVLVLSVCYLIFSYAVAFDKLNSFTWVKDAEFILLLGLFLVSYLLGSLIRLNAADKVDAKSSKYHRIRYVLDESSIKVEGRTKKIIQYLRYRFRLKELPLDPDKLTPFKNMILESNDVETLVGAVDAVDKKGNSFDKWIWNEDIFPYPVWQFRKFKLFHPENVFRFFASYRKSMGIGPGRSEDSPRKYARDGKEFFNYCKMVIYHSQKMEDPVLQEVHLAEAMVRYYAGTYYALFCSFWLLVGLLILYIVGFVATCWPVSSFDPKIINMVGTFMLIVAILVMLKMIVKRFRTLRLKEVDTVYDAFFLVHRHPDHCAKCSNSSIP